MLEWPKSSEHHLFAHISVSSCSCTWPCAFPTKGELQGDVLVGMPCSLRRFSTQSCCVHLKAFHEPTISLTFWMLRFKVLSRGFVQAMFGCSTKALFVKAIWFLLLANPSSSSRHPFFTQCWATKGAHSCGRNLSRCGLIYRYTVHVIGSVWVLITDCVRMNHPSFLAVDTF